MFAIAGSRKKEEEFNIKNQTFNLKNESKLCLTKEHQLNFNYKVVF